MSHKEPCGWTFIMTLGRVMSISSSKLFSLCIIVLFSGDKQSEPGFRVFKHSLEIPRKCLESMDSTRKKKKKGFPKVHQIET